MFSCSLTKKHYFWPIFSFLSVVNVSAHCLWACDSSVRPFLQEKTAKEALEEMRKVCESPIGRRACLDFFSGYLTAFKTEREREVGSEGGGEESLLLHPSKACDISQTHQCTLRLCHSHA